MNQRDENKKIWGFIYCYDIAGKKYVGMSTNFKRRHKDHMKEKKDNQHFHNSLRKYYIRGKLRVLEAHNATKNELKNMLPNREIFWISHLNTFDPEQKKGWNLTKGGDSNLGWVPTESTLIKMRKPKTEEHKNKLRQPKSENHKKKLSEVNLGKTYPNRKHNRKSNYDIWVEKYGKEIADGKMKELKSRLIGRTEAPCSKERRERISATRIKNGKSKGENNPMYGRSFYDVWVEKYGKEIADEKMKARTQKCKDSKNNPEKKD